jgi:phage terminase small subunit
MAGAKGRSGGARPNSGGARANSGGARANSGGARPGAGRPPKEPEYLSLSTIYEDPAVFLKAVMNDSGSDAKLRVDAAKALLRERGEVGKKEQQQEAARKIASKFAKTAPPKLVVNNR